MPLPKTVHTCPRPGCGKTVPDRLLSCPEDWFKLPAHVRQEIERTASLTLTHPQRRNAIMAAMDTWRGTAQ